MIGLELLGLFFARSSLHQNSVFVELTYTFTCHYHPVLQTDIGFFATPQDLALTCSIVTLLGHEGTHSRVTLNDRLVNFTYPSSSSNLGDAYCCRPVQLLKPIEDQFSYYLGNGLSHVSTP